MSHGQLSLEYIIILAAFFSFLFFFMPSLYRLYHLAEFSMDVRNAEAFVNSFSNAVNSLAAFENGSEKEQESRILTSWTIYSEGKTIFVVVKSNVLGKSKTLSAEMNAPIQIQRAAHSGRVKIKLKKEQNIISAEYD